MKGSTLLCTKHGEPRATLFKTSQRSSPEQGLEDNLKNESNPIQRFEEVFLQHKKKFEIIITSMAVQQDACLHMTYASKAGTMSKKMWKVLMEIFFR